MIEKLITELQIIFIVYLLSDKVLYNDHIN